MKIVIIIPTYNERENIGPLIEALQAQFATLEHEMAILVVDDNSPDGTGKEVEAMQRDFTNLHLITGEKRGLGTAYVRGMRYCIEEMQADAVFELDADFSHKPEDVPRMVAELERGTDFVIGSRYVEGGTIPDEWSVWRKLNSFFGNVVARYLAGLYEVRDTTAGFRVITTELLRRINLSTLRVQGYAFQVSRLHRAMAEGARIKEIPVDFIDRTQGESKLGLSDIVEFILVVVWIRFHSLRTFIKFGVVGASGVVVNLLSFSLLLHIGLSKYIASPVAIEISIIWNFLFNNYWTFRWRDTRESTSIKGVKFNVVSLLALLVSYSTFLLLNWMYNDIHPVWHQVLATIPASLINYFLNSYWTFCDRSQDNKAERAEPRIRTES